MTSELKKYLHGELKKILKPFGFSYNRELGYSLSNSAGRGTIGISIVDYQIKLILGATITLRIDKVEELANEVIFVMPKYRTLTHTISLPFTYFSKKENSYEVYGEDSLTGFISEIETNIPFIREFIVTNLDLKNLDKLLASNFLDIGFLYSTADYVRRILVSYLAGNEEFKEISDLYFRHMQEKRLEFTEEELMLVGKLINELKTLPPAS